ncbi:MAG: aminopeptidase P family protein [Eubacteriales bacterium]
MNHLNALQEQVKAYKLDGMLITSEPGEFYALGLHTEGLIIVTPKQCLCVTDGRYIEAAAAHIKDEGLSQLTLEQTKGKRSRYDIARDFILQNGLREMGFEGEYVSVVNHKRMEKELPCHLIDTQVMLTDLRGCKTKEEQEVMKAAQKIADGAFTEVLNFIKIGKTEQEIAAVIAYEMAKRGGLELSFSTIVACGTNGSRPHALPGDRPVAAGQFITMDFGCRYQGYCSDMTRTVALGSITEEMDKVYHTVLKAQTTAISTIKGGMTGKEIDKIARDVIEEAGYGEFFSHSLGHSLGLEIHESPNAAASVLSNLPQGVTISVEPGIYLPEKFGVRIEDVVILTETSCENITNSPKELITLSV